AGAIGRTGTAWTASTASEAGRSCLPTGPLAKAARSDTIGDDGAGAATAGADLISARGGATTAAATPARDMGRGRGVLSFDPRLPSSEVGAAVAASPRARR